MAPKKGSKKGPRNLDDLKREVELDEHRIPIEDLYRRLKSDPIKVKLSNFNRLLCFET